MAINIKEYLTEDGQSPFGKWFNRINHRAAARITKYLYQLQSGNFSNVKSLRTGVFELKIHFGPGYRVYFAKEGDDFVILLGGGTKARQSKDIETAKKHWTTYKKMR